jgi:hypothetical protein
MYEWRHLCLSVSLYFLNSVLFVYPIYPKYVPLLICLNVSVRRLPVGKGIRGNYVCVYLSTAWGQVDRKEAVFLKYYAMISQEADSVEWPML